VFSASGLPPSIARHCADSASRCATPSSGTSVMSPQGPRHNTRAGGPATKCRSCTNKSALSGLLAVDCQAGVPLLSHVSVEIGEDTSWIPTTPPRDVAPATPRRSGPRRSLGWHCAGADTAALSVSSLRRGLSSAPALLKTADWLSFDVSSAGRRLPRCWRGGTPLRRFSRRYGPGGNS
jgi:hypothetical protein